MANQPRTFRVFRSTDRQVVAAFKAIAEETELPDPQVNVRLAEGSEATSGAHNLQSVESDLASVFELETSVIGQWSMSATLPPRNNQQRSISILVVRFDTADEVRITPSGSGNFDIAARVVASAQRHFQAYERTESTDQLLGNELAEFYRKREAALLRLEQTNQHLIEQQQTYQHQLQDEATAIRKRLEQESASYKEQLEAEHAKRLEELNERESKIDERTKSIDDREAKHARRGLHEKIKERLSQLDSDFRLSKATTQKRIPMHVIFWMGMGVSLAVIVVLFSQPSELSTIHNWVKLGLATLAFGGFATTYIRWMNRWATQHADEEFRLKRLALDIDRASWLIETASEWQAEQDERLPDAIIDYLAGNLFETSGGTKQVGESTLSEVLGAASNVKLQTELASVELDRKSMDRLKDQPQKKA